MLISNVKIYEDVDNNEVLKKACKQAKINIHSIKDWHIVKKSVDARDKSDIHYVYSVEITTSNEMQKEVPQETKLAQSSKLLMLDSKKDFQKRPVVVGAGPAGLFCAYTLALNGAKPILLEQGKSVDERIKDVNEFIENRKLNPLSNIQFGEGGAGTFSDGKLTTNINSELNKTVLETFCKFGAPPEILYTNKPHIGTDNLVKIVKNIREEIIRLGGEVHFQSQVTDFKIYENKIKSIIINNSEVIETDDVVLAIGHSARNTFKKLFDKKINMEPKPFSVGVRIEHKQSMINDSQYGKNPKLKLPPAEYKLAYHAPNGRSCYTFCMCPGGTVMASSSEEGGIVTNGMSTFARDKENANSAVLVNVNPEDYLLEKYGNNSLSGIYFQKELEEKAFEIAGSNYNAPVQKVGDYLNNVSSKELGEVKPSYMPGVTFANLNDIFPEYVNQTLKEGITYFDTKLKGFANDDAIMTGVETRSSSPVKIIRDDNMNSSIFGIYPCGEGAGYAGGIMTASIDGIKVAKAILNNE